MERTLHMSSLDTALGIIPLIYDPPTVPIRYNEWPTLGQLIAAGKRVIVFIDARANRTEVSWLLPQFQMVSSYEPFLDTRACELTKGVSIDVGGSFHSVERELPLLH